MSHMLVVSLRIYLPHDDDMHRILKIRLHIHKEKEKKITVHMSNLLKWIVTK